MPKKQGKCVNIDCDNYKQIVEVETGEEFECPLCHQHLEEVGGKSGGNKKGGDKGTGPNWKLIGGAAAAVVVLGGAIAAFTMGGDKTDANKAGTDTTLVQKDSTQTTEQPAEKTKETKKAEKKQKTESGGNSSGFGSAKTPYGKYKGELQNGQPHGHGTVTFSKPYRLGENEAQPGDTYEGEFRDGRISGGPGYWKHDGEVTYVNP